MKRLAGWTKLKVDGDWRFWSLILVTVSFEYAALFRIWNKGCGNTMVHKLWNVWVKREECNNRQERMSRMNVTRFCCDVVRVSLSIFILCHTWNLVLALSLSGSAREGKRVNNDRESVTDREREREHWKADVLSWLVSFLLRICHVGDMFLLRCFVGSTFLLCPSEIWEFNNIIVTFG